MTALRAVRVVGAVGEAVRGEAAAGESTKTVNRRARPGCSGGRSWVVAGDDDEEDGESRSGLEAVPVAVIANGGREGEGEGRGVEAAAVEGVELPPGVLDKERSRFNRCCCSTSTSFRESCSVFSPPAPPPSVVPIMVVVCIFLHACSSSGVICVAGLSVREAMSGGGVSVVTATAPRRGLGVTDPTRGEGCKDAVVGS